MMREAPDRPGYRPVIARSLPGHCLVIAWLLLDGGCRLDQHVDADLTGLFEHQK